ncbi:hypothetical protein [Myxococcus xanthus]|uniref:hypothetical protein n=1 Tax=Myxococcus xanthus TaxID=34 RepID=UPI00112ED712|nr:hypothetical protein [Myxococcus xanthus]
MSELAGEMARKAEPDRLKERAREAATHKATALKQHAKEAAVAKATELKTQARETVMHQSMELKDRADSPKGWSLLGALAGAGVGSALMRKAFTTRAARQDSELAWRRDERWRHDGLRAGTGSEGPHTDMKASASDKAQEVKGKALDKASAIRERTTGAVHMARERASHARERIPSREAVQHQASDWLNRTVDEQPLLLAVGGLTLGILASALLPVTGKERKLIEPAKRRATEGVSQLRGQLQEKLQGEEQQAPGGTGSSNQAASDTSSVSAGHIETTRLEDSGKTL